MEKKIKTFVQVTQAQWEILKFVFDEVYSWDWDLVEDKTGNKFWLVSQYDPHSNESEFMDPPAEKLVNIKKDYKTKIE